MIVRRNSSATTTTDGQVSASRQSLPPTTVKAPSPSPSTSSTYGPARPPPSISADSRAGSSRRSRSPPNHRPIASTTIDRRRSSRSRSPVRGTTTGLPSRPRSPAELRTSYGTSRHPPTERRSVSAAISSTHDHARDASLSRPAPPPSLPRSDSTPLAVLPSARIASLGLTPSELASYTRLIQPLDQPPSAHFSRTISLRTTFGWAYPSDAEAALLGPPAYPDDPSLQHLNETFLRAQTGESMDHYTVFFAQFSAREEMVRAFMEAGKQAAARPLAREEMARFWDPEGGPERIKRDTWGAEVEPGETKKGLEFGRRVRKAFGLEGM